ncbi:hypothetical protein [Synechococcus phage Ssp-JY38]|nr:hypothetical protein [Synechococcus phage Yong-L2-223]
MNNAQKLEMLNEFRTGDNLPTFAAWKVARHQPMLDAYMAQAEADAGVNEETVAEDAFVLTDNEFHAAMILVNECLNGMGGQRPSDLEHDEYTWVDIDVLVAHGWSKEEAAGTFSALDAKGVVYEADTDQMAMSTLAWKWLDTKWDANIELASKSKAAPAPKADKPAKPAKATEPTQNGIKRPRAGGLCAQAWDLFDKMGPATTTKQAVAKGEELGLNANNIRIEICRWRKFNGYAVVK